MTITYTDGYESFEFEVSYDQLKEAMIGILAQHYNISKNSAQNIYFDFSDTLDDFFEDEIKEHFEEQAFEQHKEYQDEEDYYKKHDIHGGV